jgi:WD40 repeat protein
VAWGGPNREHEVIVGHVTGEVSTFDLRAFGNGAAAVSKIHTDAVSVIKVGVGKASNLLACGSDDFSVSVVNLADGNKAVYHEKNHTDFVRGLSWDSAAEGTLLSVGWDEQVVSMKISGP